MFLPLEKTYAPFICALTRLTHRATYSRSSRWLFCSLRASGEAKYRQMTGSSVTAGRFGAGVSGGECDPERGGGGGAPHPPAARSRGAPSRRLNLSAASVGGGRIRVTSIDGVAADFGGDANTLIIHNDDTPGCIAEVALALARRQINVASMQVFRSAPGGEAVMVLECDSHIPAPLEFQLTAAPGIRKVTCLNVDDKA